MLHKCFRSGGELSSTREDISYELGLMMICLKLINGEGSENEYNIHLRTLQEYINRSYVLHNEFSSAVPILQRHCDVQLLNNVF